MKKHANKLMILALASMMLTAVPRTANALIPLPSIDFSRIAENVKKTINQITEIKAEIDSNLMILREIQNGGYGAAAGMLFSKIERGDYDRLTGNIKGLKESYDVNLTEAKGFATARKECKQRAKKAQDDALEKYKQECNSDKKTADELKQCMEDVKKALKEIAKKELKICEEEFNKKTGEAIAQIRKDNRDKAAAKAAEENKEKGGKVKFKNVYSWVKGANISNAVNQVNNGGSFGNIVKSVGSSAGSIIGSSGDGETSQFITGAGNIIGGASNVAGQGGSFKDVVTNAANNSDINSGLNNMNAANQAAVNKAKQEEEAQKAAEAAAAAELERQRQEAERVAAELQKQRENGWAGFFTHQGK